MMSEIYTLRVPENFNYHNDRRSPATRVKNPFEQKPEMHYLRTKSGKQTISHDLLKASSSPISENPILSRKRPELYYLTGGGNDTENSNFHLFPISASTKRNSPISYQSSPSQKPDMYYSTTGGKNTPVYNRQSSPTNNSRQKSKGNGILKHSNSPSQKTVTTYVLSSSNKGHFLPYSPHTLPPPIHPNKKKQLVSFDTTNYNDKYDVSNKQAHSPRDIRYLPLLKSKAIKSIERSMNKYRFRRN